MNSYNKQRVIKACEEALKALRLMYDFEEETLKNCIALAKACDDSRVTLSNKEALTFVDWYESE